MKKVVLTWWLAAERYIEIKENMITEAMLAAAVDRQFEFIKTLESARGEEVTDVYEKWFDGFPQKALALGLFEDVWIDRLKVFNLHRPDRLQLISFLTPLMLCIDQALNGEII